MKWHSALRPSEGLGRTAFAVAMAVVWLLVPVAAGLTACGTTTCGDHAASKSSDAPDVEDFDLASQLPGDPWMLIFEVRFSDRDGDLGAGTAEFFVNSKSEATRQPLGEVFQQSAVPFDATSGRLGIPLRFGEGVDDGARLRLGVQLVDEAGQRSNCFTLELRFDVDAVARTPAPQRQPLRRGGGARLLSKARSCT